MGWCLTAGTLAAALLGVAERAGPSGRAARGRTCRWSCWRRGFRWRRGTRSSSPAPSRGDQVRGGPSSWRRSGATPMAADQKTEVVQALAAPRSRSASVLAQNILPRSCSRGWRCSSSWLSAWRAGSRTSCGGRSPGRAVSMWRMPDAAVWLLVPGLALVVSRDARAMPVGVNLARLGRPRVRAAGIRGGQVVPRDLGMTPGLILCCSCSCCSRCGRCCPRLRGRGLDGPVARFPAARTARGRRRAGRRQPVEVILMDDVEGVGKRGATVKVATGLRAQFPRAPQARHPDRERAAEHVQVELAKQRDIAHDKSKKAPRRIAAKYAACRSRRRRRRARTARCSAR